MATGGRTFNGSSQSGSAGTTAALQLSTLSVHGWIKNANATGGAFIEALAAGSYTGWRFAFVSGGYSNTLSFYDGSGWQGNAGGTDIVSGSLNTWYPVGVAVNGSGTGNAGKLYAGGSSIHSFTPGNIATPAGVTKYFARDVDSTYSQFEASEWAIWNIKLADADFTALAAGSSPQEVQAGNLVVHWRFNETGGTITDLISGLTLTLSGTPGVSSNGPTVNEPPVGGGGGTGQPTTKRYGALPFSRGDSGLWTPRRF